MKQIITIYTYLNYYFSWDDHATDYKPITGDSDLQLKDKQTEHR